MKKNRVETDKPSNEEQQQKVLTNIKSKLEKLLISITEKGEYFELGATGEFLVIFYNHVKATVKLIQNLNFHHFEPQTVNKYYTLANNLENLESKTQNILRKGFGSYDNTQIIIELLEICLESLYEVSNNNPKNEFENFFLKLKEKIDKFKPKSKPKPVDCDNLIAVLESFPKSHSLTTNNSIIHANYIGRLIDDLIWDISDFRIICLEKHKKVRRKQKKIWNQLTDILYQEDAILVS